MRCGEISTYSTTAKTGRGSYILDVVCDDGTTRSGQLLGAQKEGQKRNQSYVVRRYLVLKEMTNIGIYSGVFIYFPQNITCLYSWKYDTVNFVVVNNSPIDQLG